MARPLRIEFPGALYHVMSRGNERQDIVRDEADREERLDWLMRTVVTYGWRLHAFVLMTNHEHLFVETPEASLSAGMQFLNGSYTGYFNRRHGRAGHLFRGRFKGHLIEEDGCFLKVKRLPERKRLRGRPSLDRIVEVVSAHFGGDGGSWAPGRRSDDAARAIVAYRARARFGNAATEVAGALRYRGPSNVSHAVRRIERSGESLREVLKALESQLN